MAPFTLLTLLAALPLAQPVQPLARGEDPPPVVDQVAVSVQSAQDAALVTLLVRDVDGHFRTRDGSIIVHASDDEQTRLRRAGLSLKVLQEDLAGHYAERAAAELAQAGPGIGPGVGSMGGFRTLSEVIQKMDQLAASHPSIVSTKYSIGTTVEGRPIWAMRISDNPNVDEPDEPVAWYDSLHHAREPMSGESLLQFADWLVTNYPADPIVKRVIESRNLVFVPVVNPDGYLYNEQTNPSGGGLWRKNRRNNGNGTFGVDLNRNYDWEWGSQWPGGSSSFTFNDTYRGPAPFSEPETQAVRDAMLSHPPGMVISAHSASNLWLFAWGYANGFLSPLDDLLRHYATGFVSVSGWPVGTPWQILNNANGTTLDWSHGVFGNMAYTPEIGESGTDGFWPLPSRIPELAEDVRPGYLQAAQFAGGWADELELTLVEAVGDGDASIEPGEEWEVVASFASLGRGPVDATLTISSGSPDLIPLIPIANEYAPPFEVVQASTYIGSGFVALQKQQLRPRFRVAPGAGLGAAQLDATFTYDTAADSVTLDVLIGTRRELIRDDMETAVSGWSVSNPLDIWSWERGVPEGTASVGQPAQPNEDNPAGSGTQCWVTGAEDGSFASQRDVDGLTVLTSPRFDATGFALVELSYARWFANLPSSGSSPLDDQLLVEVSNNDGGSWTTIETTSNDNAWRTITLRLDSLIAPTDAMRLRFTVADVPENDLTEACIDDVVLRTVSMLPTLGLWGSTAPSDTPRLCIDGAPSASYTVRSAGAINAGTTQPGTDGTLFLDGALSDVVSGTADATGRAAASWTVPPGTPPGSTIYLQVIVDEGGPNAAWSNLVTVSVP